MLTATKDLLLPTTVTGSWPRPAWYEKSLYGRAFSEGMADVAFREQFTDAVSSVLNDQERAGLDILTNGDYHHDDTLAGHSSQQAVRHRDRRGVAAAPHAEQLVRRARRLRRVGDLDRGGRVGGHRRGVLAPPQGDDGRRAGGQAAGREADRRQAD